jgi:threonine/homoserine/homoserine lactone efflux protein
VPNHLLAFVVTAWLLAMVPGPGQALMVRQTLEHGRRTAWTSVAGTATGLVLWSTAAAVGLSAALLASPLAYTVVKVAGAGVLLYLGVATLRTLRHPDGTGIDTDAEPRESFDAVRGVRARTGRGAYLAGLATNLGNPKAGVFAISLIPQFVSPRGPVLLSSITLGLVWALVTATWYLLFTWAVDRGRSLMKRPAVSRWTTATTGAVLIMLGLAVAIGG